MVSLHSMIKNQNHRILLSLFLMLVFTTPFVVKSLHHHSTGYIESSCTSKIKTLEKPCLTCSFEFVTFFSECLFAISISLPAIKLVKLLNNPEVSNRSFTFFSYRAPPSA